ncbi:MAG: hypothetical protein ACI87J_002114 [Colwellia sp.]|jgi:hypothetical protein
MIGQIVVVPVGTGSDVEGKVETYDAATGLITVKDEDGHIYKGYEYQAIIIN